MGELHTYFFNERDERFASIPGLVPLGKGSMIKTRDGSFIVDEVQLNLDSHSDGDMGLQIFCKKNS